MAVKDKDTEEEGAEGTAQPDASAANKKKKLILFGGIGVVVLLLAIGIPLMFMGKSGGSEGDGAEEVVPEVIYKRAKLDTFIVNLSDAKRYLKVTMLLEYDPSLLSSEGGEGGGGGHGGGGSGGEGAAPAPDALPSQIKEKEPQVRDAVIQVLSSKRAEDLLTSTGKQSLKEELIESINTALDFPEPPIVQVYFTEFIIQ